MGFHDSGWISLFIGGTISSMFILNVAEFAQLLLANQYIKPC